MVRAKAVPPPLKKVHVSGNKGTRGGKQPGAGRPTTARAATKTNSRAAALRIQNGDVVTGSFAGKGAFDDPKMPSLPSSATPLDVMIEAMRRAYELGGPIAAFPYAEKAAPYLHAKISSIELKTPSQTVSSGAGAKFLVEFVRPQVEADNAD